MKTTRYFDTTRQRDDRLVILDEWILLAISYGRIRRWALIEAAGQRYLRIVLLPDGETVRNAFFDRRFKP